jgi:3-hydroxyisobutyrate dehydrogenase-like beta-hydroxyacid dehydrogenase
MMNVGWIGTGKLGLPMAARIAASGTGVRAYVRSPDRVDAIRARQVVCVSGPKEAFEVIWPLMANYSRAQFWLGDGEQARYVKLAVNLMLAVSAGMLGEALALARRGDAAAADVLDVIAASALGSPMVVGKVGFLKAADYTPTFSGHQMAKDLDLILSAANATSVVTPLAAFMRTQFAALAARGEIDQDFIAVVKVAEELAGLGEPRGPWNTIG